MICLVLSFLIVISSAVLCSKPLKSSQNNCIYTEMEIHTNWIYFQIRCLLMTVALDFGGEGTHIYIFKHIYLSSGITTSEHKIQICGRYLQSQVLQPGDNFYSKFRSRTKFQFSKSCSSTYARLSAPPTPLFLYLFFIHPLYCRQDSYHI